MKQKLFTIFTLLVMFVTGARATSGTINAAATTDLGSGNTPRYVVEQTGVGRLMKNKTGSSSWSLSNNQLAIGSSMFALQTYNDISQIKITGTGSNRTFSSMEVGTTTSNYAAATATATGKITSSSSSIIITPSVFIEEGSYVALTFSGNFNISSVELVYADLTSYTITIDKNGGTTDGVATVKQNKSKLSSITAPTYTGHVVTGYYKEPECINLVATVAGILQPSTGYTDANGKWTSENNQTLYPKWEVGDPKVIFSMENVTSLSGSDVTDNKTVKTKKTGTVNATYNIGSSAIVYNGKGSDAEMYSNGTTINLGGSGDSYFRATFLNPLAEGDVISSSTSGTFYLTTSGGKTNSQTLPYTIAEGSSLIGSTCLYVQKNGASYFTSFTITRPDESDVNNPVITYKDNTATIECSTDGATIYYTIDGSEPTTTSTVYTAPIVLTNSCTVRAKAFKGASNEYSSEIVKKDCFVAHATAVKVLQFGNGTVTDGNWSQDGYTLTNASEQAVNFGTGYTAFKLSHTQTYTLTANADVKVTKIIVVGKSWLQGSAGNAATIAIDGFTPASGSFFDYVTGGETYVKSIEFTPSTELDYGASITIRPGNNQLGAYIEVYGDVKTYTVTYNGNGNDSGTAPTDGDSPYSSGSTVTVLGNTGNLGKEGYIFIGWNTKADGSGTDYAVGAKFNITADTELYAQYGHVEGTAIIKVPVTGASTHGTITGSIGGTATVALQSSSESGGGYKFGKDGSYISITLSSGETFKTGDIINVHTTVAADTDPGTLAIYNGNQSTLILNTGTKGVAGDNKFVLPAAVNGLTSISVYRSSTYNWNGYVDYIEVTRPNATVNLNASGYATYSAASDFTVTGAKAYKATLNTTNKKITCTEVEAVPAGAGVLLFGDANAKVAIVTTTGVEALTGNDLKGTTKADGTLAAKEGGKFYYSLSGNTFKKFTGDAFIANKAYFESGSDLSLSAKAFTIVFDGETTGINGIEEVAPVTKTRKVVKNGRLVIETANGEYSVSGARVK